MARFAIGLVTGMAIMTVVGAAVGLHAQDPQTDLEQAAAVAHVDPVDLAGAVNSVGVDPYTYLRSEGALPSLPPSASASPAPPTSGAFSARVACIIRVESKGDPNAHNRSGASGLGQFLPSTWASTPQGRAGLSVWDPAANTAAINWMIGSGRAREFDAVRYFGC